jgi:hypothetical protein
VLVVVVLFDCYDCSAMIDSLRKEHVDRLENMKRVYEIEAEDMRKRMQEKSEKAHRR